MKNDADKPLIVSWMQRVCPNLRNSDLLEKKIPKPALKQRPNIHREKNHFHLQMLKSQIANDRATPIHFLASSLTIYYLFI